MVFLKQNFIETFSFTFSQPTCDLGSVPQGIDSLIKVKFHSTKIQCRCSVNLVLKEKAIYSKRS